MPIYPYRCTSCGMERDFLRKVSDPPLTICPECGKESMTKMLTAAGFQLKGSGWYATDFRNAGAAHTEKKEGDKADKKDGETSTEKAAEPSSESAGSTDKKTESTSAPSTTGTGTASGGSGGASNTSSSG